MSYAWGGTTPPGLLPAGPTGATGATGAAGPANLKIASLVANASNATATMAALGLSVPVLSGHRYAFEAVLMINDASGSEGAKFDFDASTATTTDFRCYADDGALGFFGAGGFTSTLAGDISGTGFLDDGVVIRGSFEPSSNGTLAMRFAQASHAAGSLIVYRGSSLSLREVTE